MKVNAFNVNVSSENPERLIAFYTDVVGLPRMPQLHILFLQECSNYELSHAM